MCCRTAKWKRDDPRFVQRDDEPFDRPVDQQRLIRLGDQRSPGGGKLAIDAQHAKLHKLQIDEAAANALKIESGPLTANKLKTLFVKTDGTGILQSLKHADRSRHVFFQ